MQVRTRQIEDASDAALGGFLTRRFYFEISS